MGARSVIGILSAVLVVGLTLHNVAVAQLWELGVRGTTLDMIAAWKEALLLLALLLVTWYVHRMPAVTAADVLAASYAFVIVIYFLLAQDTLGGGATARGELLALRHHLFPVAAYALGRLTSIAWQERGRVGEPVVLSAVVDPQPAQPRTRASFYDDARSAVGEIRRRDRLGASSTSTTKQPPACDTSLEHRSGPSLDASARYRSDGGLRRVHRGSSDVVGHVLRRAGRDAVLSNLTQNVRR